MDNTTRELLELARSVLRDLCHDWPAGECAAHPEEVVNRITDVLGDGYDFATGCVPGDGVRPPAGWDCV
ncbi:MAG TPA: hypothetical protein VEI97_07525 [bacterium]|nr:hypothetical protein [bacterium]